MTNNTDTDFGIETVEIISQTEPETGRWQPVVGGETYALIENLKLSKESGDRIKAEAVAILKKCVPPTVQADDETGLVIGYVQSGKTMSFTTVAALARDNNYQMIIVIAGTSLPLLSQSTDRLKKDLRLLTRLDRKWQHFENPTPTGNDRTSIADTLAEWRDSSVPGSERKTVLITVMKHHLHLGNLVDVLSQINLQGVSTLIIDDEADQAGLNTAVRQGEQSTTYQRLLALRACIPHHSFLQYTATPQAPLLINMIDVLSPRFAEVLTPGDDYVGGKEFFITYPELVETIPDSDVPSRTRRISEPPDSLLTAMRIFFLGVAAGIIQDNEHGNRSMMVHPSQRTLGHRQYLRWVTQVREQWKNVLELPEQDPDRRELLEDFLSAYNDLRSSVADLPSFDQLSARLLHAVRRTRVEEVNSTRGRTPNIPWNAAYPWILVGGQAMDRGFTVEGLTVTYMPRSVGVGNADTVQQRARFFGYKKRYLGYCRIFLQTSARNAYQRYVNHEEDVRKRLIAHRDTGQPLTEWKRAFFLTRTLKPTRDSVLDLDYMRGLFGEDWFSPNVPHESIEAVEANRQVVQQFCVNLEFKPDQGHKNRTEVQKHLIASGVSLRDTYEQLLTPFKLTNLIDSQQFTGLLILIQNYLDEHPSAACTIYMMSPEFKRKRGVDSNNVIKNLYQGEYPVNPRNLRGSIYPGDKEIKDSQGLTIQIHNLQIEKDNKIIAEDVPTLAVWVPSQMAQDTLIQEQGGNS